MSQSTGPYSVDLLIERIGDATNRLLESASALTDDQVREPSLLPGWSRGHVLTHVARNADGLRNLLIWARTGVETPQYPSREARDAQIEAGSGRPAAEHSADIAESAEAFVAEARELGEEAWQVQVHGSRGPSHPAWFTLHRRLFEVEIHHADLSAGYTAAHWPDWFVAEELYRVTGELASNPETPTAVLTDSRSGRQFFLRPAPHAKPTPDPEPITGREPAASPEPEPEPAASPEPEPAASPEPEPEPAASPEPEPAASPEPEPAASPEPEPAASAEPEPAASAEHADTEASTPASDGTEPAGSSELAVTGAGYVLLAWLLGRDAGGELSADPAGPLPEIPSYG